MNKYKTLAFNTVIFTIGNFGSKVISLLLNNLYTKNISPADLFTKSLLETLALFLIPVFTFSITEAVVRYGLDSGYDNRKVFTTSAAAMGLGFIPMLIIVPLLHFIPVFSRTSEYTLLLMIYIFTSSLRSICSQFVRARGLVKLFSLDGIMTTLTLLIFNIVFISKLGMGVKGFMISTILSDLSSAVFLFVAAGLVRFIGRGYFDKSLMRSMLRFTLPLIPTTVMWTFTGFSDQLFIGNMKSSRVFLGEDAAGLYAAASKIPNLISMLSTIFFQAWNMSAITENDSTDREEFYEKVYTAYEAVLFIGSAGLLLLVKPISALLINYSVFPEYKMAYLYSPLLIAAAVFTCLDLFLASIYTATKHTKNAFVTIAVVCVMNIVLNLCIIPYWGIQGAALATFLSYLLCFWIRIIDARYYVPFRFSAWKNLMNTGLLLLMCADVIFRPAGNIIWAAAIAAVIVWQNYKPLMSAALSIIKKKK